MGEETGVASRPSPSPAFGQADLSNCEREQIHLAASIQPHGALLVVREADGIIVQASENAAQFLHLHSVLGRRLDDIEGDLAARIQPQLNGALREIPMGIRCSLGVPAVDYDCVVHRPPDGGLVIELEQAGPPVDLALHVEKALRTVLASSSQRMLCDATARIFKDLTGFDRVMVYRFDERHGEVLSEQKEARLRRVAARFDLLVHRQEIAQQQRVTVPVGPAGQKLLNDARPLSLHMQIFGAQAESLRKS